MNDEQLRDAMREFVDRHQQAISDFIEVEVTKLGYQTKDKELLKRQLDKDGIVMWMDTTPKRQVVELGYRLRTDRSFVPIARLEINF